MLRQQNQKLKEESNNYRRLGFKHLQQQNNLYKSVIDEVRKYFNNSPEWEKYNIPSTFHCKTKEDILKIINKANIKGSE